MRTLFILPLLTALLLSFHVAHAEEPTLRRFALVVGANDGGKDRAPLRYAQRDARTLMSVLEQLGGVEQKDRVLLFEPTPEALNQALAQLSERAKAARGTGQRTELLFYYSGHSDEKGLLLGQKRVSYRELRDGLLTVGAAVHIGVLDSCASGALTRLKGGLRRAPFLMDASNEVQGHAFLTSSSSDEAAQESDRVGASFFTHYFISGLRGAADFSGDGRVTLNEAYRFAFDETLASTEDTRAGPQHAAYDIQLVGTGDLVMTDLRQPAAALMIPKNMYGRLYVRDAQGNLVVELNKPQGRTVELALDALPYQILLDQDGRLSRTRVELQANTTTTLEPGKFEVVVGQQNRIRGGDDTSDGNYHTVPFGLSVVPPVSNNRHAPTLSDGSKMPVKNHGGLHLLWGRAHRLEGASFAFGGSEYIDGVEGVQSALGVNLTHELKGAQIAVGGNKAGPVEGLQFAVAGNLAGELRGGQIGVGGNIVKHARGAQVAVGFNSVETLKGVQISSGVNLVGTEIEGAQLSLINIAERVEGAQLSLINLSKASEGVELGLVNVAGHHQGLQLGLANVLVGEHTHGLQLGLASVATGRISGAQLGLFNYADDADAQLGLLSITRKGSVHPLLFVSDPIATQFGLRFDARHTYSALIGGIEPESNHKTTYAAGFAFGVKIALPHALWIEPEVSQQLLGLDGTFNHSRASTLSRIALQLRYQLYEHLSFFGGPAFGLILHTDEDFFDRRPGLLSNAKEITEKDGKLQALRTIGFTVGTSL